MQIVLGAPKKYRCPQLVILYFYLYGCGIFMMLSSSNMMPHEHIHQLITGLSHMVHDSANRYHASRAMTRIVIEITDSSGST